MNCRMSSKRVVLVPESIYLIFPLRSMITAVGSAVAVLSDLEDRHRILERNVAVIDLRVAGAAVLSPPPPAPVDGPVNVAGISQR